MPWLVQVLLFFGPLLLVGIVFLVLHVLTQITGFQGYAPGWQVRCTGCEHTSEAGKTGMIRIGSATATAGKFIFGYCRHCRGFRWITVERLESDLQP